MGVAKIVQLKALSLPPPKATPKLQLVTEHLLRRKNGRLAEKTF